jgi:methylase of polypeptide subunit release factors
LSPLEDSPLSLSHPGGIGPIREVLDGAGYTETRILETLGTKELPPVSARTGLIPLWLRRTRSRTTLDDLVRLFLLHEPLSPEAFQRMVGPTNPGLWAELGLVDLNADAVVAAFQLLPFGDLILATDWPGQPAVESKHVMAVSGSSRTLADFTIRRHSRRTLDLGTGCGIQALLAARHSDGVWAVDRNPRAVNLARFNARLNGLLNINCKEGDWFAPVPPQEFDLVVANLPFVVCPETRYLYCQGGQRGDDLCRNIVRSVPRFLREGGCCQIVSDLAHIQGEDWRQRLRGWLEGTGCDAWVIHSLTLDAAAYAAHWLREIDGPDLRDHTRRFEAWMAYYEQERIEAVSFGLLALRRATGRKNWFRCEEARQARTPSGAEIALGFARYDYLEAVRDDRVLLDARLRYSPDLRWDQELEPSTDGWTVIGSRLRSAANPPSDNLGAIGDPAAIFLVARCRGETPLRNILTELATALGQDLDSLLPGALTQVRRLIELGILGPYIETPNPKSEIRNNP